MLNYSAPAPLTRAPRPEPRQSKKPSNRNNHNVQLVERFKTVRTTAPKVAISASRRGKPTKTTVNPPVQRGGVKGVSTPRGHIEIQASASAPRLPTSEINPYEIPLKRRPKYAIESPNAVPSASTPVSGIRERTPSQYSFNTTSRIHLIASPPNIEDFQDDIYERQMSVAPCSTPDSTHDTSEQSLSVSTQQAIPVEPVHLTSVSERSRNIPVESFAPGQEQMIGNGSGEISEVRHNEEPDANILLICDGEVMHHSTRSSVSSISSDDQSFDDTEVHEESYVNEHGVLWRPSTAGRRIVGDTIAVSRKISSGADAASVLGIPAKTMKSNAQYRQQLHQFISVLDSTLQSEIANPKDDDNRNQRDTSNLYDTGLTAEARYLLETAGRRFSDSMSSGFMPPLMDPVSWLSESPVAVSPPAPTPDIPQSTSNPVNVRPISPPPASLSARDTGVRPSPRARRFLYDSLQNPPDTSVSSTT